MDDPDVVEIPPPIHQNPSRRSKKHKQLVYHDVIDLEADEDLVVLGETSGETSRKKSKGKAVETIHGGYADHLVVPGIGKSGTFSGIQSSHGQPSLSHNVIINDGQGSKPLFIEDDYLSKFSDDYMDEDLYALLQAQFDNVDLPTGMEAPFTLLPEYDLGLKETGNNTLQPNNSKIQGKSPHLGQFQSANKGVASSSSFHSNFVGHNGSLHPQGIEFGNPWLNSNYKFGAPPEHSHGKPNNLNSARVGQNGASVVPPGLTTIADESENETLKKMQSFKQFDTVIDTSDHHFVNQNSSMKDNPKSWAKKIQDEWKILEKHLPDTIFVRVYESRMDLLRAVIIGAEGTPYHDGLFFFDVHFPGAYPNVPPLVHYHSGGLRLNPNLYNSGKVCLSLLNTWSGRKNEKWTPGVSTMLQVLVSIQGLILNAKPFFNEPGFARGTKRYEERSLVYNENTFILSVRTMMYMIKKLPKYFEDLVVGHFYSRAHDILASCKAYMEDVQVGSFVKGGVQKIDKGGRKCSDKFKADLFDCVKLLVQEFEKIGVKDCQKIMSTFPPKPTLPTMTMNLNLPYVTMNQNLPYVTMNPTPNLYQNVPYVTMNPTPNLNQNLPYMTMNPSPKLTMKPTLPKKTMKHPPPKLTMKPTPPKPTPPKLINPKPEPLKSRTTRSRK